MLIHVISEGAISQQARTYAEYRVFAALTQFADADKIRRVHVLLRPMKPGNGRETIVCAVTVSLDGSDSLRLQTVGPHAYAAINRAVERMSTNVAPGLVDGLSVRTVSGTISDCAEAFKPK